MGAMITKLRGGEDPCDLSDEQVEELHMLSSLPPKEVRKIRRKFLDLIDANGKEMTEDEFYSIPSVSINPLKTRLFRCFERSPEGTVGFEEFIQIMAVFSYHGGRDSKIRNAFKIHDFDDDGKISKKDLALYLDLVTDFGDLDEKTVEESIETVVSRTMEEASTDGVVLTFDDFVKVITTTDFETKLLIQL